MNLFDVLKELAESEWAKDNRVALFVGAVLLAAIGGAIVYFYMKHIAHKQLENNLQEQKKRADELASKLADCEKRYAELKKEYDELKNRAEEASFKKDFTEYQASKKTMGESLDRQFNQP